MSRQSGEAHQEDEVGAQYGVHQVFGQEFEEEEEAQQEAAAWEGGRRVSGDKVDTTNCCRRQPRVDTRLPMSGKRMASFWVMVSVGVWDGVTVKVCVGVTVSVGVQVWVVVFVQSLLAASLGSHALPAPSPTLIVASGSRPGTSAKQSITGPSCDRKRIPRPPNREDG